jgi:hypothetical protein
VRVARAAEAVRAFVVFASVEELRQRVREAPGCAE